MTSGVPWQVKGVRREVRETARAAARRSGMSVGEWLDTVITDSAIDEGVAPARRPPDDDDDRQPEIEREGRYSDFDDIPRPRRRKYAEHDQRQRRLAEDELAALNDRLDGLSRQLDQRDRGLSEEQLGAVHARLDALGRQFGQRDRGLSEEQLGAVHERLDALGRQLDQRDRGLSEEQLAAVHARLDALGRQLERADRGLSEEQLAVVHERLDALGRHLERRDRGVPDEQLAAVNDRLNTLSRQLDQFAQANIAKPPPAPERDDETPHRVADAISRLDQRLDQLITEGRSRTWEIERRVSAVDHAVANLERERPHPAVADPASPLDQALMEIAERQRALDGEVGSSRADLPRAPTQNLPGLERQLRHITERIETLRPCGIDSAVETLRDDLAEIGLMLKEAMPRQAVEALETELRSLAERVDSKRHAGVDDAAIAGIEHGLAEVRDALNALTPAESLVAQTCSPHSSSGSRPLLTRCNRATRPRRTSSPWTRWCRG